ncbi:AhpD family alkylhydroperoxidase [Antricoccus suffuscus]|uniref:AhpD family alkylhydroperoxidase n=1 Tax=Antricoccus suffuscus TaxID=1629062 RepID=A0A2T1A6Q5_9ACTN|nr:carboxymuconolactone decarboxylase family protein [Antricoccus suffuscus]PRZ44157.1 AhpD family alkylhydroperoxidase [Antricoccus suffuscus]
MSKHSHLQYGDIDPIALDNELGMERYLDEGALDPRLVLLVKVRTAELNGCSYCRAMYADQALAMGESPGRLDVLQTWADSPGFFSAREQAALAFAESLHAHGECSVPKPVWHDASLAFEEREVVDLLIVISSINGWSLLESSTHHPTENPPASVCESTA